MKGVVFYTILNTSSVHNHFISAHTRDHKAFMRLYDGKIRHEREDTLIGQGISQMRRKVEDSDSYISHVSDFMIVNKKYNKNHTQQASFE